ncbi:MAG: AAA family ATPase [Bacteroidota bacterium]|nr:AAA family ATPase [Bacteroidota bacterium]
MLKRISIDNFKSLVNFEVQFRELTLLMGRNGAGKTAVLDAIYAIGQVLEGHARVTDSHVFPPSSLTKWQSRNIQTLKLEVELAKDVFEYCLEIEHDRKDRKARIMREELMGNGGPLFQFTLGDVQLFRDDHSKGPMFRGDWRYSALSRIAPGNDNARLRRFMEFMRSVVVCSLNPAGIGSEAGGEDEFLARDGSNFVSWYRYWMQQRPDLAHEHGQTMREMLDGLITFKLDQVGVDTRRLMGMFGDPNENYSVAFGELSDGQRVLCVLYALLSLATGPGPVLMLDEPVNFVALAEIQPWLMELRDACESTIPQAVLASHHPEIIDYLGVRHAILLERDGTGPTLVVPLSEKVQHLTGDGSLTLSEVVARGWET